jgi:hypoxanthine phosphoribosyltransferase
MRVLFTQAQIQEKVRDLAKTISRDYQGRHPVLVGILKGSVFFLADLIRSLDLEHEVDFISISSYASGVTSSGTVRMLKDLDHDISGRDVIIVEDIIDSGLSLAYLRKNLLSRNPRSLALVTMLNKKVDRQQQVFVDYIGFEIENEFVIGYGLDYAERFRELTYIGIMEPEDRRKVDEEIARLAEQIG